MNRISAIQKIINKKNARTYLEIGCNAGEWFLKIKAPKKIGVDIKLHMPGGRQMVKECFKNPSNIFNRYYEMSSDVFFATHSGLFEKRKIDVAFVDGLHEYKQVVRDVNNCLKFLNKDGVIVMHDCNPPSALIATPLNLLKSAIKSPEWTGAWTGDVWKAIVHFRSARDDLNIFVLNCDWGLGIVTKESTRKPLSYSMEDIDRLSYEDLTRNRQALLGLKELEHFEMFLNG